MFTVFSTVMLAVDVNFLAAPGVTSNSASQIMTHFPRFLASEIQVTRLEQSLIFPRPSIRFSLPSSDPRLLFDIRVRAGWFGHDIQFAVRSLLIFMGARE